MTDFVEVEDIKVNGIDIGEPMLFIAGQEYMLDSMVLPSDATNKTVIWTAQWPSTPSDVWIVVRDGKTYITPRNGGPLHLRATIEEGKLS
jgi:hypothetical protein